MSANPFISLYEEVYGPSYFSMLISVGLYGIACMQTFSYYAHYQNDSVWVKCFVAALWALNTIFEALTVVGVYKYIMASLMVPSGILVPVPELGLLSSVMVAIPVQGFFVYRFYVFSGNNIVTPILWVISAIYQLVASILFAARSLYTAHGSVHIVGLSMLNDDFFRNIASTCIAVSALVDILIAVSMTYLLFQQRTTTEFAHTAHVLQRLMLYAVNTGMWTATFALLALILMRALPSSELYLVFAIPLCPLYCNTLLANLNVRAYVERDWISTRVASGTGVDRVVMTTLSGGGAAAEPRGSRTNSMCSKEEVPSSYLKIRKTTEVVTFVDGDGDRFVSTVPAVGSVV